MMVVGTKDKGAGRRRNRKSASPTRALHHALSRYSVIIKKNWWLVDAGGSGSSILDTAIH